MHIDFCKNVNSNIGELSLNLASFMAAIINRTRTRLLLNVVEVIKVFTFLPTKDEIQVVISLQYVKTLQPQTETSVKPISIMCAFANSKLIPILSIIMNHCN